MDDQTKVNAWEAQALVDSARTSHRLLAAHELNTLIHLTKKLAWPLAPRDPSIRNLATSTIIGLDALAAAIVETTKAPYTVIEVLLALEQTFGISLGHVYNDWLNVTWLSKKKVQPLRELWLALLQDALPRIGWDGQGAFLDAWHVAFIDLYQALSRKSAQTRLLDKIVEPVRQPRCWSLAMNKVKGTRKVATYHSTSHAALVFAEADTVDAYFCLDLLALDLTADAMGWSVDHIDQAGILQGGALYEPKKEPLQVTVSFHDVPFGVAVTQLETRGEPFELPDRVMASQFNLAGMTGQRYVYRAVGQSPLFRMEFVLAGTTPDLLVVLGVHVQFNRSIFMEHLAQRVEYASYMKMYRGSTMIRVQTQMIQHGWVPFTLLDEHRQELTLIDGTVAQSVDDPDRIASVRHRYTFVRERRQPVLTGAGVSGKNRITHLLPHNVRQLTVQSVTESLHGEPYRYTLDVTVPWTGKGRIPFSSVQEAWEWFYVQGPW